MPCQALECALTEEGTNTSKAKLAVNNAGSVSFDLLVLILLISFQELNVSGCNVKCLGTAEI